ncbi:MAG: HEPN domain-containing protein [Prevotellaceae bacterium]|jgi:uncharacterized protein (UPF0332 family)|nr:HEPN domain-containing protein [Prevotellaceae bacterium]
MTLSYKERNAIIDYRIEKAKETFKGAESNALQLQNWAIAGNRLYYAAYYMISALLLKNGHIAHTHTGTRSLFYQHFVKTNIVTKESGRIYSKLFEIRQASDYDDFFDLDENDILPLIEPVKIFICEIERLINE